MIECGTLVMLAGGDRQRLMEEFKDDIPNPLRDVGGLNLIEYTLSQLLMFVKPKQIVFIIKNKHQRIYDWVCNGLYHKDTRLFDIPSEIVTEYEGFEEPFNACLKGLLCSSVVAHREEPVVITNCDIFYSRVLRERLIGFYEGWLNFNNKALDNFKVMSFEKINKNVFGEELIDARFYYYHSLQYLCNPMFMNQQNIPVNSSSDGETYFIDYGIPVNFKGLVKQ